ncbi:unnamed protein product [Camellia sinensis]|uniref:J domain-containing protein n=1 Tax=Camellia sinensis var. sinensis TaxID=542762 RepID=A0A4S4CYS7_CAMSN|nr:chaperone protein dnaJ 20, chloroplastic-like [Camellia sinensis]THF94603.1 hypothetical protein TEA_013034 [Camellia sinensis var. sinensis]
MEIHLQMNPKIGATVPLVYKGRSGQKINKVKIISCSAQKLAMHKPKTNFYEVLSLGSENVGFDEIKKAYRTMALQYHPDVCPPSTKQESTRRFIELREAYETLSDPISRRNHDYELGLVDSLGWSGFCMQERRSSFPKEVWERQLSGLRERSGDRMKGRKRD